MEISSSFTGNQPDIPLPSAESSTKKRSGSPSREISEEVLQPLKLRRTPASHASLTLNKLTSSYADLPIFSSFGGNTHRKIEAHESLRAYVRPLIAANFAAVVLHPSSAFRSSTTETEKTVDDNHSDTETTVTEVAETSSNISPPTSEESVEESSPDWALQEPEDITHFNNLSQILESKGIKRSLQFFDKGSFGRVYEATIDGDPKKYLYKHYLKPVSFEKAEGKFWRQSDFAASRLHDIPHLVKPLFFIVLVRGADGSQKKVFLPPTKVQQFGQSLPPKTKVFLEGQLMERAPGRSLQALRDQGLATFTPDRPHFHNIARGLNRFLTASRPHNYMHRDLSLGNIIYDKEGTKKISIVDLGQSLRLRSRGKTEEMMKNKTSPNPATSRLFTGTPNFMAPAVAQQENYGAEVDAGSVALLLLNLLDAEEFEHFSSTRFAQVGPHQNQLQDLHFGGKNPDDFLKIYLEKIGPNSETERMLQQYPAVREIIDLAFRASALGSEGEAAFAAFQNHPYFST